LIPHDDALDPEWRPVVGSLEKSMLPITGPFSNVSRGNDANKWAHTWYRQKRPYDLPLAHSHWHIYHIYDSNPEIGTDCESFLVGPGQMSTNENEAKSKAWSKFQDDISVRCEAGVNLVEGRQAVTMIAERAKQLARIARDLKRGNLRQVVHSLFDRAGKPRPSPKEMKHFASKSLSAQWLELHFGWAPLVQDIYNGITVLEGDFGTIKAKGRASSQGKIQVIKPNPWTRNSTQWVEVSAQYRALVRITNPNLALARNMGLVNPATLAWELIPFSFVIDWFTNVSQFLGAWNEFLGYKVEKSSSTTIHRINYSWLWNTYGWNGKGTGFYTVRELGLNRPGLYIKPFHGFSVVRAATAMALLIGFLPTKVKGA
jgi:hypothetical protein